MLGAAKIGAFFQPISNLTTQRVAYDGNEWPPSSTRNNAFELQLRRKMLITPFCAKYQEGHYK
jgi:hypothetical protein